MIPQSASSLCCWWENEEPSIGIQVGNVCIAYYSNVLVSALGIALKGSSDGKVINFMDPYQKWSFEFNVICVN